MMKFSQVALTTLAILIAFIRCCLAAGEESWSDDGTTRFTYRDCARFVRLLAGVGCTRPYNSFLQQFLRLYAMACLMTHFESWHTHHAQLSCYIQSTQDNHLQTNPEGGMRMQQ